MRKQRDEKLEGKREQENLWKQLGQGFITKFLGASEVHRQRCLLKWKGQRLTAVLCSPPSHSVFCPQSLRALSESFTKVEGRG